MKLGPATLGSLGVLAGLVIAYPACAQHHDRPGLFEGFRSKSSNITQASWNAPVTLDALPTALRAKVTKIVQSPTLTTRAPAEEFPASLYEWLLDHPDRTALAWR